MPLHDQLERCVEYIATDGIIGSEPAAIQRHLSKPDPSIDATYFTYLYKLLLDQPSVRPFLTTYPLPDDEGHVQLGTVPLPADYVPPSTAEGSSAPTPAKFVARGREAVFWHAGEEHLTSKQVTERQRLQKERQKLGADATAQRSRQEATDLATGSDVNGGLWRYLDRDDGEGISIYDLDKLVEKWGSRFRLRCTDDAIYESLTGTPQRSSRITPLVFHIIQLVARSREKGLTTVELGPMVGTSQGSMHYYLKTLMELDLIVRVPVTLYSSVTNLVIFHRFKHLNMNWHAANAKLLGATTQTEGAPQSATAAAEDEDDEEPSASLTQLGLSFSPLNELELAQGIVPQQRLLQILDHPALENHLLRNKYLLSLVGWPGESALRHRRMMLKCTQSLLADGVVEMVLVGEKGVKCLRLVKYNPDNTPRQGIQPPLTARPLAAEDVAESAVVDMNVEEYSEARPIVDAENSVSITMTIEHQAMQVILDAGGTGATISDISEALSSYFRRALEFHLLRSERSTALPHLQQFNITSSIETELRERRLRFHGVQAFREEMSRGGHLVDDALYPPLPPQAGHWADIDFRDYCKSLSRLHQALGKATLTGAAASRPGPTKRRSKPAKKAGGSKKKAADVSDDDESMSETSTTSSVSAKQVYKKARPHKYTTTAQARGRPRKYIHVVDLDGEVNRRLIGQIPPQPGLAPIYIYMPDAHKLVPAPPAYDGRGPPPVPTPDKIKMGKDPAFFAKFPCVGKPGMFKPPRSKANAPKRKAAMDSEAAIPRRSKRAKLEQTMAEQDESGDDLASSNDEFVPEEADEGDARNPSASAGRSDTREEGDPVNPDEEAATQFQGSNLSHDQVSTSATKSREQRKTSQVDVVDTQPERPSETASHSTYQAVTGLSGGDERASAGHATPSRQTRMTRRQAAVASEGVPAIPESRHITNIEEERTSIKPPQPPIDSDLSRKDNDVPVVDTPPRTGKMLSVAEIAGVAELPSFGNRTAPGGVPVAEIERSMLTESDVDSNAIPRHETSFTPYPTLRRGQSGTGLGLTLTPSSVAGSTRASTSSTNRSSSSIRGLLGHRSIRRDAGLSGFSLDPSFTSRRSVTFKGDQPVLPDASVSLKKGKEKAEHSKDVVAPKRGKGLKSLWGSAIQPSSKTTISPPPASEESARNEVEEAEAMDEPTPTLGSFVVSLSSPRPPTGPASSSGNHLLMLSDEFDAPAVDFALPTVFTAFGEGRRKTQAEVTKLDEQEAAAIRDEERRRVQARSRARAQARTAISASQSGSPVDKAATKVQLPTKRKASEKSARAIDVSTSTTMRPASPSISDDTVADADARSLEGTPLRDISDTEDKLQQSETPNRVEIPRVANTRNRGRVDLGAIRRMNEVVAALREGEGILTYFKLSAYHSDWTKRVAGSNVPHAPSAAYNMDKKYFRATINALIDSNRIKATKTATMSLSTGSVVPEQVLYLPETDRAALKAYIQSLNAQANQIYTVYRPKPNVVLAEVPYSEAKGLHSQGTTETRRRSLGQRVMPATEIFTGRNESRRTALLRDYTVISNLFGYQSGRCRRMEILHRAIIRATNMPDTRHVVSRHPRIIALPLLFEELTIGEWLAIVPTSRYDARLEELISTPEGRSTKLRELSDLATEQRGGFGGYSRKKRFGVLLSALQQLRMVEMLAPQTGDIPVAHIIPSTVEGETLMLATSTDRRSATHYEIYDRVPVYHVATEPSPLLGVLPVVGVEDLDDLWSAVRAACLQKDRNTLPVLPAIQDSSASYPDRLQLRIEDRSILTHPNQWQHRYQPNPAQQQALDHAIDWTKHERIIQPDQVADFAWSNALPVDYTETAIEDRLNRIQTRIKLRKEREIAQREQARIRQSKAQASLQVKIAEVRAKHAAEWEQRVRDSATRVGIPFEEPMIKFVSRQTLLVSSIGDADRSLSNKAIDEHLRLYVRRQKAWGPLATGELPAVPTRDHRRRLERTKRLGRPKRDPTIRLTRRKKNWNKEEEDTLIDCEAIIRARSRDVPGHKGRSAMSQIFPDVGHQTLLSRFKKQLALPGKQAYFEQLEEAWYHLWKQYGGTDELPDPTPNKPNSVDLKAHLAFMRAKINKGQLRQSAIISSMTPADDIADLPAKLSEILASNQIKAKYPAPPGIELLIANLTDERRQQGVNDKSLFIDVGPKTTATVDRTSAIIRTAMKMCIATPDDTFNQIQANHLLSEFPSNRMNREIQGLNDDKTINRLSHNNAASSHGRRYVFSLSWMEKADGPFPAEFHAEAEGLDRQFVDWENGFQWPVIGKPGELAELMNMVSNDEVDFDFDLATAGCLDREPGDYNTRRINDDALEVNMRVFRTAPPHKRPEVPIPSVQEIRPLVPWRGEEIGEVPLSWLDVIIREVEASGSLGISRAELEAATELSVTELERAIATLTRDRPQRVFWAGYDTARLVAITHWADWTLPCRTRVLTERGDPDFQKAEARRCLPRRWVDIWGDIMVSEWTRSVRAMIGYFVYQSNTIERNLREKVASHFDRQEVNDLLQFLSDSGVVRREWLHEDSARAVPPVEATDAEDEPWIVLRPVVQNLWR